MDTEKLKAILAALEGTKVTRLDWASGGESFRIELGTPAAPPREVTARRATDLAAPQPVHQVVAAPPGAPAQPRPEPRGLTVTSPFVGTFYRAHSPEAPPFVEPGSVVRKGQVLCIVEAMKLMNEIEAEAPGRVLEVLVQNGSPVEFGEPLFKLEPI
jgi:acetyl-CoA carboxylase biotin carboxyl carrier protein